MAVTWRQFAFAYEVASKTTAAWSKTIGATGDYAAWAAMIADMPDLIAHAVTVTIQAGTTLTKTCELKNKHGITKDGTITIQAEKYFPTSGVVPTADSATATTLRDAALATAALGNDYFNGCWVFIVDGTGTDNGFVLITDYVDATGDVVVASWPGTQPDNTSRYLIVGALIDGTTFGFDIQNNSVKIILNGIGVFSGNYGVWSAYNSYVRCNYCGVYNTIYSGIYAALNYYTFFIYGGIVGCNSSDHIKHGGVVGSGINTFNVYYSGVSDNKQRGIYAKDNSFANVVSNFGDNNGAWGTYTVYSGQAKITGTECSGSSGNHSDPGTAGTANADQASAY